MTSASGDLNGVAWLPGWRQRELVLSGELSPSELVRAALDRIEGLEPALHAFITVTSEQAMERAGELETARNRGEEPGPLFSLPISLKDEVWTRGVPSTGGSLAFLDFVPDREGLLEATLRRAGAVVVGKANMPEFASWDRSWNRLLPESRNPWDTSRISGASSGGSAAAVAAGQVPLSIGSDGGGSIRIPSALCGAFGLYPTAGRVPSRDSFSYSTAGSLGPITRDVRDGAVLLQAIAGPDPADPTCFPEPPPDFLAGLDGGIDALRMAWTPDLGHVRVHPGVAEACSSAARDLESAGAHVEEPRLTIDDVWEPFHLATACARFEGGPIPFTQTVAFRERFEKAEQLDLLTSYIRRKFAKPQATRARWEVAEAVRKETRQRLDALFESYDVILSPAVAWPAPVAPEDWVTPYPDTRMGTNFTALVNFARLTAATYPVGLVDGLPVGLQMIGPAQSEAMLLRVARSLEAVRPWSGRPLAAAGEPSL
jgi:aspartyl-tRNA(Asn)/glutamyl-tRNA(Gln) amidotransferase subunit A